MNKARVARSALAVWVVLVVTQSMGLCWGINGHTLVSAAAIQILPDEMKGFYKANARHITTFSTLPDDWKGLHRQEEGPNHYINFEELADPPTMALDMTRKQAEGKFGAGKLRQAGYLPWVIEGYYAKLVRAFRVKNWARVGVVSAVLGHYVADAHVPLHATSYYDGKPEDRQKGLHKRWEILLLEHYPLELDPGAPEPPGKVRTRAFEWCMASWKQTGALFAADDKATAADPGRRGDVYYRVLNEETGGILKGRLNSAARALAGVWMAAWTQAGKPKLPSASADYFWGL